MSLHKRLLWRTQSPAEVNALHVIDKALLMQINFDQETHDRVLHGSCQRGAQLFRTPPMNVLGSGTWPENSAPEKSKPGFCKGTKEDDKSAFHPSISARWHGKDKNEQQRKDDKFKHIYSGNHLYSSF